MSKRILSLVAAVVLVAIAVVVPATAMAGGTGEVVYTVKPGDNLWTLADKYLGNGSLYTAIVTATNSRHATDSSFAWIDSTYVIQPGWKLLIPTAVAATTVGRGSWTLVLKCDWLRANFPQTDLGVQQYVAGLTGNTVPLRRITIHKFQCGDGTEVYDGGIINGPVEGWNEPFTVRVPAGGVVDAYPEARFTGDHFPLTASTERATSGSVTALRATVWAWWDEHPPVAVTSVVSTTTGCVDPVQLATQMNWRNAGWADQKFGGLRVELSTASTLPPLWEAITSGRAIKADDADRTMAPGVWTIYPPFSCREQLGYSK